MSKNTNKGVGMGTLGIVFLVLKLTKVINWSWWFVLLPFYAWLPIMMCVIVGIGIYAYILKLCGKL